ncbi:transposase [Sphingomonas carotinifaciens]|uniref:transposase n=1 Tax=Sphingomonas carotinifaciens TaxID=1166323 RepID=UPI001F07C47A|nr:transposase [Sphingomonas carotinifaciens]
MKRLPQIRRCNLVQSRFVLLKTETQKRDPVSLKRSGLLKNTGHVDLTPVFRSQSYGSDAMMGTACGSGRSGPGSRTIEAMLPRDHLLRRVDRLLDMGELRAALARHYSPRGRPSVDPELLIRMALISRIYAIRSERRLCEELRYNLAYRWFCRLLPGAAVPHHSTFSKNRHGRFRDAGVFRLLFENTVRHCITAGLVAGKDAAIDASFIAADASWQRKVLPINLPDASRATRPVREWLTDRARTPKPLTGTGKGFPGVSRTDPAAAWSARTVRGRFGYALNVLIDTPSGAALDVEATPARFADEVDAGRDMLARAADRFGYRPKRVVADKAYGSATFLAFVRDHGALPHIPVIERSEQTKGKFPREAFIYDREHDRFTCPDGKALAHRGFHRPTGVHRYSARPDDCRACALRKRCTDGRHRALCRMEDEDARDLARAEMRTGLFKRSMRLRRGVERLFADAKVKHGMVRLHLRGIRGAEEEFLVGAAVLNLLLLARPDHAASRSLAGK